MLMFIAIILTQLPETEKKDEEEIEWENIA